MSDIMMDPDCTAGKHSNCDDVGWDVAKDTFADCPCECHGK